MRDGLVLCRLFFWLLQLRMRQQHGLLSVGIGLDVGSAGLLHVTAPLAAAPLAAPSLTADYIYCTLGHYRLRLRHGSFFWISFRRWYQSAQRQDLSHTFLPTTWHMQLCCCHQPSSRVNELYFHSRCVSSLGTRELVRRVPGGQRQDLRHPFECRGSAHRGYKLRYSGYNEHAGHVPVIWVQVEHGCLRRQRQQDIWATIQFLAQRADN